MSKKRVENYIYRLNDILGAGSFGTVYKGIDQKTKEEVAIKVINKKKINLDQYMRQALRLEIRILNKINSENVVRFRDVIQTTNNYYIIQEYCNQGDLGRLIKEKTRFDQQTAISFMIQILLGFYELIRHGIVHRDMKPQNILIKNGVLKIADFGLARTYNDASLLQSTVGTPLYQSPQLLGSEKYSYKCDVWAIGLIFYEMLYGKLPWKSGGNLKTLLENITKKKLQFPQQPQISKQVKMFITDCLQKKQQDRADWQSIYSSVIFGKKLPKYQNLKQIFAYTVTKLRKSIHESNLDLERFYKGLKLDKNTPLNRKQFSHMMMRLSSDLTEHQIQYMFEKFDQDRNGTIDFSQFQKCLENAEVRSTSMNRRDIKKILSITVQDEVDKAVLQRQQRLAEITERLRHSMEDKQIYDLYELFINCDQERQGYLNFETLLTLLRKIDPGMSKDDGEIIFYKFDQNQDKKISFQQFYKNMCLITGSPIMGESKKLE